MNDISQTTHWRVLWSNGWLFAWAVLFSFFVSLFSLALPFFMLLVYDRVLNARSIETLTTLALLAGALILGMGVFDYARRRLLARFAGRLQAGLEEHLVTLPPLATTAVSSKALGTAELDQLRGFVHSGALRHSIDVLWLPMFLVLIFLLSNIIGWISVGGLVLLTLVYVFGLALNSQRQREAKQTSTSAKQASSTLSRAPRWLGGQVFSGGAHSHIINSRTQAREAAVYAADRSTAFDVALSTLRWFFSILVLSVGASLVLKNQLTIGGMIACMVLVNRVFFPAIAFLNVIPDLRHAVSNWHRVGRKLASRKMNAAPQVLNRGDAPVLELRSVFLRSDHDNEPVLSNVSITITPGEIVQISGPAGSGKSLLGQAMAWARRPAQGLVLGYGHRISTLRSSQIGDLLGYVPEIPLFLEDTIGANISCLDHSGCAQAVEIAARRAGLHNRIVSLKNGYKTRIDEAGFPLSRGDRELLSLARALYHKPKLIIVDQPSETQIAVFSDRGFAELQSLLDEGGSLVLLSREPIALAVPTRNLNLRNGTLCPVEIDPVEVRQLQSVVSVAGA